MLLCYRKSFKFKVRHESHARVIYKGVVQGRPPQILQLQLSESPPSIILPETLAILNLVLPPCARVDGNRNKFSVLGGAMA